MLDQVNYTDILFLDIETVPGHSTYSELNEEMQLLWDKKSAYMRKEDESAADMYFEKAGIWAEFGKIICISVGILRHEDDEWHIRLRSYAGDNEKELLEDFADMLVKHFSSLHKSICAHNGKEFDIPYLCRRMMIHNIPLPNILNMQGKKPWEIPHLDTLELWKFGDYKHYTSLRLLAAIFDIPTPKDDIDGSEVAGVYWKNNDLDRIVRYCEKDVITTARLLLRMGYRGDLKDKYISRHEE